MNVNGPGGNVRAAKNPKAFLMLPLRGCQLHCLGAVSIDVKSRPLLLTNHPFHRVHAQLNHECTHPRHLMLPQDLDVGGVHNMHSRARNEQGVPCQCSHSPNDCFQLSHQRLGGGLPSMQPAPNDCDGSRHACLYLRKNRPHTMLSVPYEQVDW